jgi:phosphatidate phosphatase PAH1
MNIQKLFAPKPFYAGFGNKGTDAVSYRAVDVPDSRILIINPQVRDVSDQICSANQSKMRGTS